MHPLTRKIIDRSPGPLKAPVELTLRTIDDTIDDRVPGLSAEVAFFVLLSLPPLVLAILGSVGFIGEWLGANLQQDIGNRVIEILAAFLTADTLVEIEAPIREVIREGRGDIATIGFVLAVYSASRAVRVVLVAMTIAYDLEETRPGWLQRVWGFGLTLAGIVLSIIVVPLLVAGPRFGRVVDGWLRLDNVVSSVWDIAYWPVVVVVATAVIASLYHFGAPWWTPWRRDIPGAVLAMLVWLAGSVGLRHYVQQTIVSDSVYQPIAGPLVILLWIYVTGFAVLLGAELNAEIEKMWPTIAPHQRREGKHPSDGVQDGEPSATDDDVDESEDAETAAVGQSGRPPPL